MLNKLNDRGPQGLQRAHCDICNATFTVAKGECTGCIRRAGNRKQGVVFVVCGALLGLFGYSTLGVSPSGLVSIIVIVMALGITAKGIRAIVSGRNAED